MSEVLRNAGSGVVESTRAHVIELIERGSLERAAIMARELAGGHPEEPSLDAEAGMVEWLRGQELPRDRLDPWLEALRQRIAADETHTTENDSSVAAAIRAFLARGMSQVVESRDGRGSLVDGLPVGCYLLEAGLAEEAAASLYATSARFPANGAAALALGNALLRLGQLEEARDAYRRAFRVAPFDLELGQVEDEEVRELAELTAELELEGDPRAWLPAIGLLEDVLPFSALDPVPGAGFGTPSRVYDLLIAHKGARSHGERTAIRRDLRELAPKLFDALLTARKLDAVPTPVGNA